MECEEDGDLFSSFVSPGFTYQFVDSALSFFECRKFRTIGFKNPGHPGKMTFSMSNQEYPNSEDIVVEGSIIDITSIPEYYGCGDPNLLNDAKKLQKTHVDCTGGENPNGLCDSNRVCIIYTITVPPNARPGYFISEQPTSLEVSYGMVDPETKELIVKEEAAAVGAYVWFDTVVITSKDVYGSENNLEKTETQTVIDTFVKARNGILVKTDPVEDGLTTWNDYNRVIRDSLIRVFESKDRNDDYVIILGSDEDVPYPIMDGIQSDKRYVNIEEFIRPIVARIPRVMDNTDFIVNYLKFAMESEDRGGKRAIVINRDPEQTYDVLVNRIANTLQDKGFGSSTFSSEYKGGDYQDRYDCSKTGSCVYKSRYEDSYDEFENEAVELGISDVGILFEGGSDSYFEYKSIKFKETDAADNEYIGFNYLTCDITIPVFIGNPFILDTGSLMGWERELGPANERICEQKRNEGVEGVIQQFSMAQLFLSTLDGEARGVKAIIAPTEFYYSDHEVSNEQIQYHYSSLIADIFSQEVSCGRTIGSIYKQTLNSYNKQENRDDSYKDITYFEYSLFGDPKLAVVCPDDWMEQYDYSKIPSKVQSGENDASVGYFYRQYGGMSAEMVASKSLAYFGAHYLDDSQRTSQPDRDDQFDRTALVSVMGTSYVKPSDGFLEQSIESALAQVRRAEPNGIDTPVVLTTGPISHPYFAQAMDATVLPLQFLFSFNDYKSLEGAVKQGLADGYEFYVEVGSDGTISNHAFAWFKLIAPPPQYKEYIGERPVVVIAPSGVGGIGNGGAWALARNTCSEEGCKQDTSFVETWKIGDVGSVNRQNWENHDPQFINKGDIYLLMGTHQPIPGYNRADWVKVRKKIIDSYLFEWDLLAQQDPSEDEAKWLRGFLHESLNLDWVKGSDISYASDTITLSSGENSIEIELISSTEATLSVNGVKVRELTVKDMDGTTIVYDNPTPYFSVSYCYRTSDEQECADECYEDQYADCSIKGTYYFTWENIPGDDEGLLRNYLKSALGLGWADDAEINRDGNTITASYGSDLVEIQLSDDGTKASLEANNVKLLELIAKEDNGEHKIYEKIECGYDYARCVPVPEWEGSIHKAARDRFKSEFEKVLVITSTPECDSSLYELGAITTKPFYEHNDNVDVKGIALNFYDEYHPYTDRHMGLIPLLFCGINVENVDRSDMKWNDSSQKYEMTRDYDYKLRQYQVCAPLSIKWYLDRAIVDIPWENDRMDVLLSYSGASAGNWKNPILSLLYYVYHDVNGDSCTKTGAKKVNLRLCSEHLFRMYSELGEKDDLKEQLKDWCADDCVPKDECPAVIKDYCGKFNPLWYCVDEVSFYCSDPQGNKDVDDYRAKKGEGSTFMGSGLSAHLIQSQSMAKSVDAGGDSIEFLTIEEIAGEMLALRDQVTRSGEFCKDHLDSYPDDCIFPFIDIDCKGLTGVDCS